MHARYKVGSLISSKEVVETCTSSVLAVVVNEICRCPVTLVQVLALTLSEKEQVCGHKAWMEKERVIVDNDKHMYVMEKGMAKMELATEKEKEKA